MKKLSKWITNNLSWLILVFVMALCAGFLIAGHPNEEGYITLSGDVTITEDTKEFIKYSQEKMKAYVTDEFGNEVEVDVPTVDSVDSETAIESGQGAYIYAPTDSYSSFKNYTLGKCWNTDGYYGAQCWDLGDLFWQNYAGRNLSTCGTGAAKGAWNCKDYNAGDEFELIYDKTKIQAGDWIIFSSGTYGHIGMALGNYNNGYVTLLGQNQGGGTCDGGGAATNIINISLASFSGAFRPKTYEEPEPTPTPTPTPVVSECEVYNVSRGDTMGKIMNDCEGYINWGTMNEYADSWVSDLTGNTVYYGWTYGTGVGLYAGDTIRKQ